MADSLSISALARELGVTTRTIRFYEEQGLIDPERRGQERVYGPEDRATLEMILRAKSLGFTLGDCHTLLALVSHSERHLEQQDILKYQDEIASLKQRLDEQREAIDLLTNAVDESSEQLTMRLSRLQRPKAFISSSDQQLDLGFLDDHPPEEGDSSI